MIPAIAAQMMNGSGNLANSALAFADFTAGVYIVGGSPVTLDSIVSQPGWITANGLEIPDNVENGMAFILGGLLAAIVTGEWTIVIEYQELTGSGDTYPFFVSAEEGWTSDSFEIRRLTNLYIGATDYDGVSGSRFVFTDEGIYGPGIHRLAMTRTNAKTVLSVDGAASVIDTSPPSFMLDATRAAFGGVIGVEDDWSGNGCHIRSIAVYEPKEDAFLPVLSAL